MIYNAMTSIVLTVMIIYIYIYIYLIIDSNNDKSSFFCLNVFVLMDLSYLMIVDLGLQHATCFTILQNGDTPWKFNILVAPEKWWLQDKFPIGKATCQGLC